MPSIIKKEGVCTRCLHKGTLDTYPRINVGFDHDLKQKVKDGSLFVWECPECGNLNLIVYETLYHDPQEELMVWLYPDQFPDADLERKMNDMTLGLSYYTLRRVSDIGSLVEKVNIRDTGLEDTVVELCKYVTRMDLIQKDRQHEKELMDTPMRFYKIDGPDNDITFSFPLQGQMKGIQIGFNVYEDCRGIFQRNPSIAPPEGFAVVDQQWLTHFIR